VVVARLVALAAVIVTRLVAAPAVVIARLGVPAVVVAFAVMMVAPMMVVLALMAVALVLLVVAGGVVGAVRGQCRAASTDRQDQRGGGRRCGSLEHLLPPLSDESFAVGY
jgi:membrane protein implicated in regulation of membrane protease activity